MLVVYYSSTKDIISLTYAYNCVRKKYLNINSNFNK